MLTNFDAFRKPMPRNTLTVRRSGRFWTVERVEDYVLLNYTLAAADLYTRCYRSDAACRRLPSAGNQRLTLRCTSARSGSGSVLGGLHAGRFSVSLFVSARHLRV